MKQINSFLQLLDKGCLENMLTDDISSCIFNKKNTGNARRENYYNIPQPRLFLIKVQSTTNSPENAYYGKRYLVVHHIQEGNVEIKEGNAKLIIDEAYLYENGKNKGLLSNLMINDNVFKIMKEIAYVSCDPKVVPVLCLAQSGALYTEAESPTMRINNVHICQL